MAGFAAVLALGACDEASDEPNEPVARVFVGEIDGTDIDVAVLVDGDAIAVYQCGGPQTVATQTRWYRGTIGTDDDVDAFVLETDGVQVVGRITEDGTVEADLVQADDTRAAMRVDPVDDDADAGVFVEGDADRDTAVIVQGEGTDLSAQGASCSAGTCSSVIILPPIVIDASKIAVQITDGTSNILDVTVAKTLAPPGGF